MSKQAWHTSKLALITTTMFVPTGIAMLGVGWSCTKHGERRWHSVVPLTVSGLAFMCAQLLSLACSVSLSAWHRSGWLWVGAWATGKEKMRRCRDDEFKS